MKASTTLAAFTLVTCATVGPASAQEPPDRAVTIEFDVGDFDAGEGDWPITAVIVSGDLEPGEPILVELRDADDAVLWSAVADYQPPATTIAVEPFVAVGDVEETAIAQATPPQTTVPEVAGDAVTPPAPPSPRAAADDPVPDAPGASTPQPTTPPPAVEGDVVDRPQDLLQRGNGWGGAGQLALSMVIAVVFVAILFRTPLPSASTQRWRR